MQVATFGEGFHYFVYSMRKGERQEGQCLGLTDVSPGKQAREQSACPKRILIKESPVHDHMERDDYLMHMQL